MMGMEEVKKSDIGREQGSLGGWTVFLHILLINPMLLGLEIMITKRIVNNRYLETVLK